MNLRFLSAVLMAASLGPIGACSQSGSPGSSNPNGSGASAPEASLGSVDWSSHGSTACSQYLTPDLVGQIFDNPNGESKRLSDWSCSFDISDGYSIDIVLITAGAATFDADPNAQGATPVNGIGDKAVRTVTGIEAYKAHRGICQIDATPPFRAKLKGDALAQKLGEVCNKLFAL